MSSTCRVILMGDPEYFRIKAGANPHTRDRWGRRKDVDRDLARRQWDSAVQTFRRYGVRVQIIPAVEGLPGLVFPANAGFLLEKKFYLSNVFPGRAAEKEVYGKFISSLGLAVKTLPEDIRFEGEADFFSAAGGYLLTYGKIVSPHWIPALGFPPYRRVYGFRTDKAIIKTLRSLMPGKKILSLELADESYYHGDTVACAFGKKLEYLMVYAKGLTGASLERLKSEFTGTLIYLSDYDAALFAANSFCVDAGGDPLLFCPAGLSEELHSTLRVLKICPVPIDVSEFLSKGGGSVKCMICDLGPE